MNKALIISCEHAGNLIPEKYKYLFQGNSEVLDTHRGIDIGALEMAKRIRCNVETSFFFTQISRLLIEVNRSVGHPDLFSEFSEVLSNDEKNEVLGKYYYPYRDQVERAIAWHSGNGHQVFHLSIHTFTPELNGEKRQADIGLLFDPARAAENEFCGYLKEALENEGSGMVVRNNYPYAGTDDGLTTSMRNHFSDKEYCGIEIEINQKFPLSGEVKVWENVMNFINHGICSTIRDFVHPGLVNLGKVA